MNVRANRFLFVAGLLLALVFAGASCSDLGDPLRLFPRPEISVTTLEFGAVPVGGSSTRSATIANTGEADLQGVAAVSCPEFSIESGGGAYAVRPGGVHTVAVRYTPAAVGASDCQLTFGDGLRPVALHATGTPAPAGLCVASVSSIDFGSLALGANKLAAFKLYSRGTADVQADVSAPCGELQFLGGNGARTIPVGDSLVVTVQFTPSAGGTFSCSISTGPGNPVVTVTGSATSVSFANQIVPIFNRNFCTIACHSNTFSDVSAIVNVPASGYGAAVLVKPFDPANSVLYGKVAGSSFGSRMPLGGLPLPGTDIARIRTWILEGAHNN
ncbi:MAG: choice-of-anchor D domain-containing protein [Candidatus Eisenbacteria bacterium]